jgi:PIN domain nuclease of toxin-antitoxin system
VRLLLDTHVVLWWLSDDPTLSADLKDTLDREPDAYVSPVSVWKVATKQASGKLEQPDDLAERISDSEFRELPIRAAHAVAAGRLPAIHRDPFDRMLVAQAQCEDLTVVTRDRDIMRYDVAVLEA